MKPLCVALLLPGLVLADFRYESTTRMTGGTVMKLPFGKKPEPTTTTHYMKGGRMATVSKDGATIFDFDQQLYTFVDSNKKQYWQMTFAEMQQAMADMQKDLDGAQRDAKAKTKDIKTEWKMDVQASGVEKDVNGFLAKQVLMTMDMSATDASGKEQKAGSMRLTMDMWNSEKVPGYSEYLKFYERIKDKGAWMNPQQWRQAAGPNGMADGMRKMQEEMMKVKGLAVLSITRMGMSGMGDMSGMGANNGSSNGSASGSSGNETNVGDAARTAGGQAAGGAAGRSVGGPVGGILGGALGGRLGGFGRKKQDDSAAKQAEAEAAKAQQAQAEANARKTAEAVKTDSKTGMMVMTEMVTDASGFSTAPIGDEVFAIPAGYSKVDSDFLKRKR